MAEHQWEKHQNCTIDYCNICEGGLSVCTVCGLFEGCLTTECPGVPSYRDHGDAVYNGSEDFVEGQWRRDRMSLHSPAGISQYVEQLKGEH